MDIKLYEKARELLPKLGYRSFSQLINELLSNWLKSVEGGSKEGAQEDSNSYNSSNITDITDSYNSYSEEEEGEEKIPELPCKSCEFLRGSYCSKHEKPITEALECPKMKDFMMKYFRIL